jgi:AraC-like DNA-binding protein
LFSPLAGPEGRGWRGWLPPTQLWTHRLAVVSKSAWLVKSRGVGSHTLGSVLTIYEQIQLSVEAAEEHLRGRLSTREGADAARMSPRTFQQYFPALTGYRFTEYLRKRRLSEAVLDLADSGDTILEIAFRYGYESHEAFTRAFKKEFGFPPSRVRLEDTPVIRTRKIDLIGEVNMGVLTKKLPKMTVICFDGFKPDPEIKAHEKLGAWMRRHPEVVGTHRIFGHNIDYDGNLAFDPDNVGYRVMMTVPEADPEIADDGHYMTIEPGTFVVTGIEGSFEEDPTGAWITAGWRRLQEMMRRNGIQMHPSCRCYEESLEPVEPGNVRMDLYTEIV